MEEEDHASANDEQKGEDLGVGEHVLHTRRPPHIVAVDGCQDACNNNNNTLYLIVIVMVVRMPTTTTHCIYL